MSRRGAFVVVLIAIVAAQALAVAPARAGDRAGGIYTSPNYGYTLAYGPEWTAAVDGSTVGVDLLVLERGTSWVYLSATEEFGTDVVACVKSTLVSRAVMPHYAQPPAGGVAERAVAIDAEGAAVAYHYQDPVEDAPATLLIQCRYLAVGETPLLVVEHFAPAVNEAAATAVLAALLTGVTVSDAAGPTATRAPASELRAEIDVLAAAIDPFWREIVAGAGKEYRKPRVVVVDETTVGCWHSIELIPNFFSGLYCPFDETIYLDLPWLAGEAEIRGRAVVAVVLAHEWAHHVQHLLGVNPFATVNGNLSARIEQQADCQAGAWTAEAEDARLFTAADVDGMVVVMVGLADPHDTSADASGRHGSGAQRARAFLEGYSGGPDACMT